MADHRPGRPGRSVQVRVKRCGKSAPAPGVTRAARQTPLGARPNVGRLARPMSPGRPQRWMVTRAVAPATVSSLDRTPPTGRLTVDTRSDALGPRPSSTELEGGCAPT